SVRRSFGEVRQALWTNASVIDHCLTLTDEQSQLIHCQGDTALKIDTEIPSKSPIYRLRLNGSVVDDEGLKIARKKISGTYVTEDIYDQTDFVLSLVDNTAPLTGFPLTYLQILLAGQAQALEQAAEIATALGERLAEPESALSTSPSVPSTPKPGSFMLDEARRGLRDADVVLRKAMSSIGGLESGFATILDKEPTLETAQAASEGPAITPEAFTGEARDLLLKIGQICREITPELHTAQTELQQIIETTDGLTLEQYQQAYTTAVATAQTIRERLQTLIAQLRTEIAAERLSLVAWRIHAQVQGLSDSLRWGVIRQ
ncbi:MAG: hypothetical protein AAF485_25215, partial [Chloroflexota bacterium]